MRNITIALSALIALTTASAAWAQTTPAPTNTPVIDKREAVQEKRIEQGVKSGALTPAETAKLEKREGNLQAAEAAAKADGTVTKGERAKMTVMENKDSRAIAAKKHNKHKAVTPPA